MIQLAGQAVVIQDKAKPFALSKFAFPREVKIDVENFVRLDCKVAR